MTNSARSVGSLVIGNWLLVVRCFRGTGSPACVRVTRRGFTLIEILMALSILLLGVVGVYAIFAVGLVNHKRAVDNTTAAVMAGSIFDDIAANYDIYYFDHNRNGRPDLSEDVNANGVDDWFEPDSTGRFRYPIPRRRGYRYEIRYERGIDVPQELFVTVRIFWEAQGVERAESFHRTVFIKNLEAIDG
ncbi:MAG: prepilin-type N-terminal cleavage/methylation domain-containing protein [Planctomycetota bacterium]|nr:prepilin-type N-terminal cleavage/methylation domain-containing protein [Planctomycetota bacterium]